MPAFLISPIGKLGAAAGILLALVVYRGALIHQRDRARAELAAAQSRCAELEASNASLAHEIRDQNAAVEAMRKDGAERTQAMNARIEDSARAAKRAESRAAQDAGALARAPIAAGCEQAMEWGRNKAMELGKW